MNNSEAPKGLMNIISEVKETPEYRKKVMEMRVSALCEEILRHGEHLSSGRYVESVAMTIERDTIILKLDEDTVLNNGGNMREVALKIAVNPGRKSQCKKDEFKTIFTKNILGIKNNKFEKPTINQLENYQDALDYLKITLESNRKTKNV